MWPDNERAMDAFRRVGTRWMYGAMGGVPTGLRWEAIYPLIDRMDLKRLEEHFRKVHATIRQAVGAMPDHGEFVAQLAAGTTRKS